MKSHTRSLLTFAASVLTFSTGASRAVVLFDGISDVTAFNVAPATGHAFMGEAVALDAGAFSAALNSITSFDVGVGNLSGTNIVGLPVRLNMFLWNTSTPSSTTAPAFADQIGTAGSPTFVFDFASFTLNTGFLTVATLTLASPLTLTPTSGTTIGISLNWQVNQGAGFVNVPNFTTIIHGGAGQPAPTVGTNVTGAAPNFGYYRSASGETNGNFLGTSARNVGTDSGLLLRINGPDPVPEPTATVLGAVFGLTVLSRRRR